MKKALILLVLTGLVGGMAAFALNRPVTEPQAPSTPLYFNDALFETLAWAQVNQVARQVSEQAAERRYVIDLIGQRDHGPAIYTRALLLIADGKLREAHRQFGRISVDKIPPALLYTPFRLARQFSEKTSNPYQPLLVAAANEQKLPRLLRARVLAGNGQLEAALTDYLGTDPASWRQIDMTNFAGLLRHAGLAPETRRLLQAATKTGRLNAQRLQLLMDLLAEKPALDTRQLQALIGAMAADTQTGAILRQAAKDLHQLRSHFVAGEYTTLVTDHADTVPHQVGNESTLLLFLSAVAIQNRFAMDRWSQELKRRFPDTETRQWVHTLLASAS